MWTDRCSEDRAGEQMTIPDLIFESRDGTRLGVFVDGDGPPLVMVHGSIADHTTFDALTAELAGTYRVFRMDRRGFGRAEIPPSNNCGGPSTAAPAPVPRSTEVLPTRNRGPLCDRRLADSRDGSRSVVVVPRSARVPHRTAPGEPHHAARGWFPTRVRGRVHLGRRCRPCEGDHLGLLPRPSAPSIPSSQCRNDQFETLTTSRHGQAWTG